MAKNNLVKWIIGATSVAAFTGFIGVAKQFDATKANVSTANEGDVQSATTANEDATKQEWQQSENESFFGHEGREHDNDDEGEEGEHGGYFQDNTGNSSVSGNNTTTQPTQKHRSRAS